MDFVLFFKAAIGWIIMGIALIVYCVRMNSRKAKLKPGEKIEDYSLIGMCLGMVLGMSIGQAFGNAIFGMAPGMMVGLAAGSFFIRK